MALLAGLCLAGCAGGDGDAGRDGGAPQAEPAHPRLFFSAGDVPGLRARKDGAHAFIWEDMLEDLEGLGPPLEAPDVLTDIRWHAEALVTLALAQLVDPALPYEERMRDYFFHMLRYPNWEDPARPFNNHDLTVGHFLFALSAAYDWHGERLAPAERAEVVERLARYADGWMDTYWMRPAEPAAWTEYKKVANNHHWINNLGMAAAALVLEGEVPGERSRAWLDRTETNLSTVLAVLEDDGTSHEGVPYHSYGQANLFLWLDMRDRRSGENTAAGAPWFANSILYDLYSITPGGTDNYGGVARFGDAPPYHYFPPRAVEAWLARRLRSPLAQWMAVNLDRPRTAASMYLWYDPSVPADFGDPPAWHLFADQGIFVWRSSWEDDAVYFSLKCGSYFGGHEHPDAGHFVLERAGTPYATDCGYSYRKMSDEHNLILVDGTGQHGEGEQWMEAVDPARWAGVPFALADDRFFDLVADPAPMMRSAKLGAWRREVLGFRPGVFVVRDTLEADGPARYDWLLHSFASEPPDSVDATYAYWPLRTRNPWAEAGDGLWRVEPQDGAPPLQVADLSAAAWAAQVEPSFFVPERDPATGLYNVFRLPAQLGFRLRRTREASGASSVVSLRFGEGGSAERWDAADAEGLTLREAGGRVTEIVWPAGGGTARLDGTEAAGVMAGRQLGEPATFGRLVTQWRHRGVLLLQASEPVSLYARLEHAPSPEEPRFVRLEAGRETAVSLHCPGRPGRLTLEDGTGLPFSWHAGLLSFTAPEGAHRVEVH